MKTIRKIWHFLVVFYTRLFMTIGLYGVKSRLYRAIFEREFKNDKLFLFYDFHTMGKFIKAEAWRGDNLLSLFDAVGYPGKAQRVFEGKLHPNANFDCDEFAIWLVCTIEKCKNAETIAGILGVGMMSVIYAFPEGLKISGHNVCLIKRRFLESYNSETFVEKFFFMDYGTPIGPFNTPEDAAKAVAANYGANALIFSVHDSSLRHLETKII